MSVLVRLAPVRSKTLKENIVDSLTEALMSGKFQPGERINESELARQLQVSRAPIREALQQLQEQGLIMNHARRGMFVVSLEEEDLQKINSLRVILEAEALRLARAGLTPQVEQKLAQLVEKIEHQQDLTPLQVVRYDLEFHRTVWSLSRNEYMEKTLTSLTAPIFAYAVLVIPRYKRLIVSSHRPLLEFLRGERNEAAEELMFQHLSAGWQEPGKYSSLSLKTGAIS
jgi:DNA-binding GntR family transcriptional regulator